MKRRTFLGALGGIALASSGLAAAQTASGWTPGGPVELIVAAGAGGGNDRTARLLAKVLTEGGFVKSNLIVINKPGAGGVIAQNYLNAHPGSGNYLMITNPALITNPLTGVGTAKYTEVTPVAQLFTEYVVLFSREGSELKSGKDVIARWKRDPGALTLAVAPGVGAGPHIAAAMVAQAAGIDPAKLRVIPYATAGEAMTALLGGHVDLMSSTPLNVKPQLLAGKIRALGITSPKRLPGPFASVPTWREQGADIEFGNWRGVVGPAGMSRDQLTFWENVFATLIATPAWKAEMNAELATDEYMNSADSRAFLDQENARLGKTLVQLGLSKGN
jgi:putative tricarboxylic transport membrane protein